MIVLIARKKKIGILEGLTAQVAKKGEKEWGGARLGSWIDSDLNLLSAGDNLASPFI